MTKTARLFVSYRRGDSSRSAIKICDVLRSRLSNFEIFMDLSKIQKGEDWERKIDQALLYANAAVVVIGPRWAQGFPASPSSKDIVTKEIEHFLRLERGIAPVLVDGATMPPASALPQQIRPLRKIQAFTVSDAGFADDIDLLAEHLPSILKPRGDHYNNYFLGKTPPNAPRARPFYYGEWETQIKLPDGGGISLHFVLEDGDVRGTYLLKGEAVPRSFAAKHSIIGEPTGKQLHVTAIYLEGVVKGLGPFAFAIPVEKKVSGVYAGTNDEGWHFWTTID